MRLAIPVRLACVFGLAWGFAARASAQEDELQIARRDADTGVYYRAEETLYGILEESPERDDARLLLLDVLRAQGKYEAADEIDSELAGRPIANRSDVLAARAAYAFERGRLDAAEEAALAAIDADGKNLDAATVLAQVLRYRGHDDEAKSVAQRVVRSVNAASPSERTTSESDLFLGVGRLYEAIGALDLAAEHLVQAEALRKREKRGTADVLVVLGDAYRQARSMAGDQPRAFSTYRDALEQNPALVRAKLGRIRTHFYVQDTSDAEREIAEVLAIKPNDGEALTLKARLRTIDGRYSEALSILDGVLASNPNAKEALAERAATLHLLRRTEEREQCVTRALAIDPTYGEALRTVGDAISSHYRFAEAIPFHRRALEIDDGDALTWISLGRDLCFVGQEKEGAEALERSKQAEDDPTTAELDWLPHPWRANMLTVLSRMDKEYVDGGDQAIRFRIHTHENPIMEPRLRAAFDADGAMLRARYGWSPDPNLLVENMASHTDFSVRTVGFAGLGAVGACFGPLVTLLSARAEGLRGSFCWRRTALHELAHVYTLGRSNGRVPRWLTEGCSVYEEFRADPQWYRDQELELLDAFANGTVIPLAEFNAAFRSPRVMFAYFQGGLWVEFAVERYGFDSILRMLDAYAEDLETPQVIDRVFGKATTAMDEEFRAFLLETRLKGLKVQPTFDEDKRRALLAQLRKSPDAVDTLVDAAWACYQGGRAVDADVHLSKALKKEPTHPGALRLAARRALDRGRKDLARENLEAAFTNGGEEFTAAMQLAELRGGVKDFEGARQALRIAIACFPHAIGPGSPYLALHESLMSEQRTDEAMKELANYVALDETAVPQRLALARWHESEARFDVALRLLREVENVEPFSREAYAMQARVLTQMNRPADAITAWRSALLVDPRMERGYSPPPAEETAASERREREDRAEILVSIAELELDVGDRTAARRDLQEAVRLVPGFPRAVELLEQVGS